MKIWIWKVESQFSWKWNHGIGVDTTQKLEAFRIELSESDIAN